MKTTGIGRFLKFAVATIASVLLLLSLTSCGEGGFFGLFGEHEHAFTERKEEDKYLAGAADCTHAKSYYYSCECGEVGEGIFEVGSPLGHTYTETVTEATCSHSGYTTYACECGHYYIDNLVEKGEHTWGEWANTIEPNCLTEGKRTTACTECGEVKDERIASFAEVDNANHGGEEGKKSNVSCTDDGMITYRCKCGNEYSVEYKLASGHSFGEWVVVSEATCYSNGKYERVCASGCGEKETKTVYALGHNYVVAGVDDNSGKTIYECTRCSNKKTSDDDTVEVGDIEVIYKDLRPVDVAIQVLSSKDMSYLLENIIIYDSYFEDDLEYMEKGKAMLNISVLPDSSTPGLWNVLADGGYDYDTTYTVVLPEYAVEKESGARRITFTTEKNPDHDNIAVYRDDIVFLKTLEQRSPGYYPYSVGKVESSGALYVKVCKVGVIKVDQILCIGDITSLDEVDVMNSEKYYLGRVASIVKLGEGEYVLRLEAPTLDQVFDAEKFSLYYDQEIEFDDSTELNENLEAEAVRALYNDEDFLAFLNSTHLAARKYAADMGLDAEHISVKSFLDNIDIKTDVKLNGSSIGFEITGTITIPLKTVSGQEFGNITVKFVVDADAYFNMNLSYKIKWWWFIPTGLSHFDLSFKQGSNIKFTFDININADYTLDDDADGEKSAYAMNLTSNRIHLANCRYAVNSNNIEHISEAVAKERLADAETYPACKVCRPELYVDHIKLTISNNVIHTTDCDSAGDIEQEHSGVTAEFLNKLTGASYCEKCKPQDLEGNSFKDLMKASMKYSDWGENLKEIKRLAAKSDINKSSEKSVTLATIRIPIVVANVTIDLDFVLDFKLEASFSYKYEYEQENIYGIRLEKKGGFRPYSESNDEVKEHSIQMMGMAEVRVGFAIDANVAVAVIGPWANAGLRAGAGCYARVAGVYVDMDLNSDDGADYAAAYFEMGIYVDVEAYYTLLFWHGEITILDKEFPLFALGYDTAYYSYVNYVDTIKLGKGEVFDIGKNDLLLANYFDLKTLTSKVSEIDVNETEDYTVTISFEKGYCKVSGGIVTIKEDTPCNFVDTMVITVEGNDEWWSYKKGNATYDYLGEYRVDIVYEGDEHKVPNPVIGVEATCENDGKIEGVCEACENYVKIIIPAKEHIWLDANCTEPKRCNREGCGKTEGEALGHTEVTDAAVAPTCTETGLTEGSHCSVCNEVFVAQSVVDALGHTEGDAVVENEIAPDCTNTGSYDNVVYCSVCSVELSREGVVVSATGHDYGAVAIAPTCEAVGYTIYTCHCGDTYTDNEVDALGHAWLDANCTEPKRCDRVGCTTTEGEALGHDWADATCTEPEKCQRSELECTATQGAALGHSGFECDGVCDACGVGLDIVHLDTDYDGWCNNCGAVVQIFKYNVSFILDPYATSEDNQLRVLTDIVFESDPVEVIYGITYTLPVPTAECYTFGGWYTADGTKITDGDGVGLAAWNIASDTTVVAKWEKEYLGYTYINDVAGFEAIRQDLSGSYVLVDDINISEVSNWVPFGGYYLEEIFTGELDGLGHKIIGLTRTEDITEKNSRSYFGLFGCIGETGSVSNIVLTDVYINITGPANNNSNMKALFGSVAGKCMGTVSNVETYGSITYSCCTNGGTYVGGICGYALNATIENCINRMAIWADRYAAYSAGICGYAEGGTITSCANYGDITAIGTDWGGVAMAGGIAGMIHTNNPTFSNNYNYGNLSAKAYDNSSLLSCTRGTGDEYAREANRTF